MIKDQEVIPVYDYVHLLKRIRNNLLSKNLDMNMNKQLKEAKQYASWSHIVTCYDIDKNSFLKQRQLSKITEKHIYPHLISKMRVKYASQICSKTVSNFIDVLLNFNEVTFYMQLTCSSKTCIEYLYSIICI